MYTQEERLGVLLKRSRVTATLFGTCFLPVAARPFLCGELKDAKNDKLNEIMMRAVYKIISLA